MTTETVSTETLRDIYEALYEMNLEAAEEDYLDYYMASFAPSEVLSPYADDAALRAALASLIRELIDDLGDEDEVEAWFIAAGGSNVLYAAITNPSRV